MMPGGIALFTLDGTYSVLSVSDAVITLSSPSSVNPEWSSLTETDYLSPILSTTGPKWIGPFILESSSLTEVYSNFIALQGLYKSDGKNQVRFLICLAMVFSWRKLLLVLVT